MNLKEEMLYLSGKPYELKEERKHLGKAAEGQYHETPEDMSSAIPSMAIKYYNAIREDDKTSSMSSFKQTVNTEKKREKIFAAYPWLASAYKNIPGFFEKLYEELLKIEKMGLKKYKLHYSSRLVK